MALAEHLDGVIINADSMQVYRELAILTARPSPAEAARLPHALYGFVSGAEAYSAGRYANDAAAALAEARSRGRVPIIVGGTGLYFRALLTGLSPIPAADPEVRSYWRQAAARLTPRELHAVLAARRGDRRRRIDGVAAGRIGLPAAEEAIKGVRQAGEVGCRRPGRQNGEVTIDLHAVGVDDDAAEALGEGQGQP